MLPPMPQTEALFILDPLETFDPRADSSFVMITEALRRGIRPLGAMLADLSLHGDVARAQVRPIEHDAASDRLRWSGEPQWRDLPEIDVVLMRKDPPVDANYIAATWILDRGGTLVLNDPRGLRTLNEKLAIAAFTDLTPKTYVSRDHTELRQILRSLGGRMILKPVYGFGGREILIAREGDPNLGTLLELATAEGARWTVAQEYMPAAKDGDKRILLVDGHPIGAVLRVPASGELRNNFHAGGTPAATELDDNDRAICSAVAPMLRELGQFFVGIDVIGGRLTEINVTSPTGMQEINRLEDRPPDRTTQAQFWDALETRLGDSARS